MVVSRSPPSPCGPTQDADLHPGRARPDAVGGVAHVGSLNVVGQRPFEDEDVVSDLHVAGQGAVDPAGARAESEPEDGRVESGQWAQRDGTALTASTGTATRWGWRPLGSSAGRSLG